MTPEEQQNQLKRQSINECAIQNDNKRIICLSSYFAQNGRLYGTYEWLHDLHLFFYEQSKNYINTDIKKS
ncbi:hypothetical protein C2G38_2073974 [Gigaspora rosea]|uniref:Uncharacterized protein n=1 Tax=Gigaspora rosea TaxID=44941 RepID=A0A397VVI3_9GLOM|nr:hypothetical protein C2G38_2073974 [Gigaspora rosea]